jgi:uncharacterized glyoxalase superfamily protein PhnB
MSKSYKPKNMPDLMPYLIVQDAQKSIDFYQKSFGFELANKVTDDKNNIQHVEMRYREIVIMFCPESACESMGMKSKSPASMGVEEAMTLYCYCEDVDAFHDNAVKHGAKSTMPPADQFWGDRMCALTDPDNYKWSWGSYLGEK